MKQNIIVLVSLIFFSCTNSEKHQHIENKRINLPPLKEEKIEKMSNLFDVKRYVPLQTVENKYVGEISKLITTSAKYIIFDAVSMRVFIFDKETGNVINIVEALGQGPREYSTILDITYQKINDEIVILAPEKILWYTSNGEYKYEKKGKVFASNISVSSFGKVLLYADYSENTIENEVVKNNLLMLKDDYSIDKKYMPFNKMVNSFVRLNPFINLGKDFLYYEKKEDILYGLDENEELSAKYHIDYGNNNAVIAQKVLSDLEKDKTMSPYTSVKLERELGYYSLVNVINLETMLFLTYNKDDHFFYAFYNKDNHSVKQYTKRYIDEIPPIPLENDFDEVPYYSFVGGYQDVLIAYALPEELIASEDKSNKRLDEVRHKLEEDGNFVIVEFELKK